ncbi:ATP-binding cassette domain-containing protein [bacterium]|nr:ATP-binding cassette domain-containing protein [bacterium]
MIHFDKVHLRFDTGISLRDLSFDIQKNEFVYLFGPSGSGKSSVLNLIYMDLFPNDGDVKIFDYNSSAVKRRDIANVRQKIGMIFQDFKLLADRDVFSNISLPLELQGFKSNAVKSKVVRQADALGLRSRLTHYPSELSVGEQQKVALARSMILSPDILLADEPTAHLDEKSTADVLDWIWKVHEAGTSVLFATHNEQLLKQNPARKITLSAGEIVEDRSF